MRIRHYRRRCYVVTEGIVTGILCQKRTLRVGKEDIKYDDIVEMDLL